MAHTMPSQKNGFTLIELAISLMVIGLLIGGVLKGQELIKNASITQTIRQIKAYDAATLTFRDSYNALPGDIVAVSRIPNCTAAMCNSAGNGNGRVADFGMEQFNFFPHLTKAGMIQGPPGGPTPTTTEEYVNFFPVIPLDNAYILVQYMNTASAFPAGASKPLGNYYLLSMLSAFPTTKTTAALDRKMDDGNAIRGTMVSKDAAGPNTCFTAGTGEYLDNTNPTAQCYPMIDSTFTE